MKFSSVAAACLVFTQALAFPAELSKRQSTSSQTGTSGGFYYSFWTDGSGLTYTNGGAGEFSVTWQSGSRNFVSGKEWQTGSARDITYTADYNPDGNSYLTAYGWTTSL